MSWDVPRAIAPLLGGLVQVRLGFTPLSMATTIVYILGMIAVYGFFVRPSKQVVS